MSELNYETEHKEMIDVLIQYGIRDKKVLSAMGKVKRHRFIPEKFLSSDKPYGNHPCHIGFGQTISQPFIVAYMTSLIDPQPGNKILEIGSGSGYQTAILAELGASVFSIEIVPELAEHAKTTLQKEGYEDVFVFNRNGYEGYNVEAPYDYILVTCAPENVPEILVDQLKNEGKMIIPVGSYSQKILIIKKLGEKLEITEDIGVRFVPMVNNTNHQL